MKTTLVVVTDLGGFKAFRLDEDNQHRSPRLELIEEFNNADAHTRLVEKVTDFSGRFPRRTGASNGTGAMSDGERHNIDLERRKRSVRKMAKRLNALMREVRAARCWPPASREINHPLWNELDPEMRTRIERNVPADLTKVSKANLLWHFQPFVGVAGRPRERQYA